MSNQMFLVPDGGKRKRQSIIDCWVKDGTKQVIMLCDVESLCFEVPICQHCDEKWCCRGKYRQMRNLASKVCGCLGVEGCTDWPNVPAVCLLHPFTVNARGMLTLVHDARLSGTCWRVGSLYRAPAWQVHKTGLGHGFGAEFVAQLETYMPRHDQDERLGAWVRLADFRAAASHEFEVAYQGEWPDES